jgi:hypothetical protein
MSYSKIIRKTAGISAVIGFFMIVGCAGVCDYMEAIDSYFSIKEILPKALLGFAMMLPAFLVFRDYDNDYEDDWEDWDDEIYED